MNTEEKWNAAVTNDRRCEGQPAHAAGRTGIYCGSSRDSGAQERPYCYCDTPVGPIRIAENSQGICAVTFVDGVDSPGPDEGKGVYLAEARSQLLEYFAGERRAFDLPLSVYGTEFQERVWSALQSIPYGETRSYQQVARLIGSEKAVRAVGMANHRNPLPILIPCHRVVGKNGKLVGYAGGIERKRYLLDLELARGF